MSAGKTTRGCATVLKLCAPFCSVEYVHMCMHMAECIVMVTHQYSPARMPFEQCYAYSVPVVSTTRQERWRRAAGAANLALSGSKLAMSIATTIAHPGLFCPPLRTMPLVTGSAQRTPGLSAGRSPSDYFDSFRGCIPGLACSRLG